LIFTRRDKPNVRYFTHDYEKTDISVRDTY
jgi:hypothetical protein